MSTPTSPPDLSLDPPSTFIFSTRQCTSAYCLNQFAIGLKQPDNRAAFLADELGAMQAAGLSQSQIAMVQARDWAGLIARGGHVLAIVKIAYSLGVMHHEVGAAMCGMDYASLRDSLPRMVDLLPADLDDASHLTGTGA